MTNLRLLGLSVCLCSLLACHSMRFRVDNQASTQTVTEHKSFFLWGIVPRKTVDVRTKCPYGVTAIAEEESVLDGVAEIFTLGIWSPRQSTYYCAPMPVAQVQP